MSLILMAFPFSSFPPLHPYPLTLIPLSLVASIWEACESRVNTENRGKQGNEEAAGSAGLMQQAADGAAAGHQTRAFLLLVHVPLPLAPHPPVVMSKKKGLSMEEKCKKVLEIFTETQDVFQLKDVEKMALKKGVIVQSVKDCVNQLVADNLIETDKIGSSTYFWMFRNKQVNDKNKRVNQLKKQVSELKKKRSELRQVIRDKSVGKEEQAARDKYNSRIAKSQQKKAKLVQEIDKYKDCDPDEVEKLKKGADEAVEAVERWTTNVFSIRRWVVHKTGMTESDVNKQFNIPPDFDYLDED